MFIDSAGNNVLASKIGKSKGLVSSWRNGRCVPSFQSAKLLVEASGGALTLHDVRPDIYDPPAEVGEK